MPSVLTTSKLEFSESFCLACAFILHADRANGSLDTRDPCTFIHSHKYLWDTHCVPGMYMNIDTAPRSPEVDGLNAVFYSGTFYSVRCISYMCLLSFCNGGSGTEEQTFQYSYI